MDRKSCKLPILFCLIILAIAACTGPASAATITIDNSSSIADALLNVGADGTLILQPGIYFISSEIKISNSSTIMALTGHGADDTIIDAQAACRIFNITGGHSLTIEDLTLRNGAVSGATSGGAISCFPGDVTLTDTIVTNCTSASDGGGAIYCYSGEITLTGTTFTGCSAVYGGAIYTIVSTVNITATSCTFTGCTATSNNGGGIYSSSDSITLTNTTFTGCSAGLRGGAIYSSGNVNITSCTFTDCSASGSGLNFGGGAIFSSGTGKFLNMTSSTITNCTAPSCAGGAVYSGYGLVANITSSTITGCTADWGGGAFFVYSNSNFTFDSGTITGCSVSGSGNQQGGGAFFSSSTSNSFVHFSRIYNNTATNGSAWYNRGGIVNATNNWWGSNDDPSASFYDLGTVTSSPWLVLGGVADPSTISLTGTSVIRANMTHDVNGTDTSGSGYLPDGILMTFAVTGGSGGVSPSSGTTADGAVSTTFTPSAAGNATVNVTVDNQTVSVPVVVSLAPPTANFSADPLTGTPPLNVTFTDTSTGAITTWNWSFGDGEWFNTTDSALKNTTHTYSSTGTYTVNLTVSNSGGSDTSSKANYITVSTSPAPTSSSGGSSRSGGGSNTDTGTGFATDLKAGENISFEMNKGAVYMVSFTTETGIKKLMITVRKTGSVPSSVGAPDTEVYEYEDVNLYYTENSDLSGKTFWFRVSKSWLAENGYSYDDIVMLHYNGETGVWEELETTFTGEDGTYYYYSAETPSFSWFAIAVEEGATIVSESTAAPATKAATIVSTAISSSPGDSVSAGGDIGIPNSSGEQGSWTSLAIPLLLVVLAIIVIAGIVIRKRKEKYPDWWDKEFK